MMPKAETNEHPYLRGATYVILLDASLRDNYAMHAGQLRHNCDAKPSAIWRRKLQDARSAKSTWGSVYEGRHRRYHPTYAQTSGRLELYCDERVKSNAKQKPQLKGNRTCWHTVPWNTMIKSGAPLEP